MNKIQKAAIGLALPFVLLLSGCAVGGSHATADDSSKADKPTSSQVQQNPLQKKLGEVVTYKDGFEVSVSQPAPFQPSAEAAGVTQAQNIVFTVKYTNNSKKNVSPAGYPQLTSGGVAASAITDLGANIGIPPTNTLLPGQSLTFQDAYSVADPSDLTYQITPSMEYQQAIFTSK